MKKFIYIFTLLFILSSCSNNSPKINYFEKFPLTISLKSKEIKTPPILYQSVGMELLTDVLVVLDFKEKNFFHVFTIPEFQYMGGFIQKGEGPNEEIQVYPYFKHLNNNTLLYQNLTSLKVIDIDIPNKSFDLVEKVDLPPKLGNLIQTFKIHDKIYGWAMHQKTSKEYIGFDANTKEIFEFGPDFPIIEMDINTFDKSAFFDRTSVVKPDESLFATVYNKFPILRVYSKKGKLLSETRLQNNQEFPKALLDPNASMKEIDNLTQNYKKVKATNKYIYALYCGKTNKEMKLNSNEVGLDDFSNEIHVWDWNGNPVKKILLDKSCFSFCVSNNDKYLVTSSLNVLDKLFKYNIDN